MHTIFSEQKGMTKMGIRKPPSVIDSVYMPFLMIPYSKSSGPFRGYFLYSLGSLISKWGFWFGMLTRDGCLPHTADAPPLSLPFRVRNSTNTLSAPTPLEIGLPSDVLAHMSSEDLVNGTKIPSSCRTLRSKSDRR